MRGNFDNEYDSRLLESGQEEKTSVGEYKPSEKNDAEEYYDLPPAIRSRTRIWSVSSLVLSILSVLLCAFYYVSLVFAVLAVGASLFSRRTLGFFDRCSVIGLIVSIFGFVFGISVMTADIIGLIK